MPAVETPRYASVQAAIRARGPLARDRFAVPSLQATCPRHLEVMLEDLFQEAEIPDTVASECQRRLMVEDLLTREPGLLAAPWRYQEMQVRRLFAAEFALTVLPPVPACWG